MDMGDLANKYLGKIIEQKLFDGPGDLPDTLEGLNANDFTAVVYNAVKGIIADLRESGELKPDQNLSAAGITAQILLETGNGKSSLASKYNNFGGIKATPSWKGKTIMIPNSDGNVNWRVYPSVKKGLEEQVRFFLPSKNPRYFKAGVLSAKNAAEHAKRVQDAGYAGSQTDYADRVIKMAGSISKRLERANPQYSKGITYIPEKPTSIPKEIVQKPNTLTTNIARTEEPAVNVPVSIGKPNPAQVFLNPRTKVDLNTPIEISNPSTKIFDNSFYNDPRNEQQLKQAAASQKIIDSPIKYKKGGKIKFNNRYYGPGGPLFEDNDDLNDGLIMKPGYGAKRTVKYFEDYYDPIQFNVDAETGNYKKYNFDTGKFEVTNIPYKGDMTGMMSHWADRYLDDDTSEEAQQARLEKAEDLLRYNNLKAAKAMQQFADRADYSAEEGLDIKEQGASEGYYNTYKNTVQCISGTSACFSPITGASIDTEQPNYATVPHYTKDKKNKGDFKINTRVSAGTQKDGKGTTGPGDNIPMMGGNETFASYGTRNYGFEMLPPGSKVIPGQTHVHRGYEDWKDNNALRNTFQYGRVDGGGGYYHAQIAGNEGTGYFGDKGILIQNNPGYGAFENAYAHNPDRNLGDLGTAQFNWVYDRPYYAAILDDIRNRNNLTKND